MKQTRDYHFDAYAEYTAYVAAGRHRREDGSCKSIREIARDLRCDPSLLPAEGYIKGHLGATLEELRGLTVADRASD